MYKPKNPIGYRTLFTWKQAGEIYCAAKDFTRAYLNKYSDQRLTGHIDDSARSVQRNIEEGFKRSTTKEYVEFLGFSRASLEELKGDFEELKREWKEGIRWGDRGKEWEKGNGGKEWEIRGKVIREEIIGQIEKLLDLIYGEDCMMGRQIMALEHKMVEEKTLPRGEMIKRGWNKSNSADKKFWKLVEAKYGIKRDNRGILIRDDRCVERNSEKPL